jgi:hypothetical protein
VLNRTSVRLCPVVKSHRPVAKNTRALCTKYMAHPAADGSRCSLENLLKPTQRESPRADQSFAPAQRTSQDLRPRFNQRSLKGKRRRGGRGFNSPRWCARHCGPDHEGVRCGKKRRLYGKPMQLMPDDLECDIVIRQFILRVGLPYLVRCVADYAWYGVLLGVLCVVEEKSRSICISPHGRGSCEWQRYQRHNENIDQCIASFPNYF